MATSNSCTPAISDNRKRAPAARCLNISGVGALWKTWLRDGTLATWPSCELSHWSCLQDMGEGRAGSSYRIKHRPILAYSWLILAYSWLIHGLFWLILAYSGLFWLILAYSWLILAYSRTVKPAEVPSSFATGLRPCSPSLNSLTHPYTPAAATAAHLWTMFRPL